MFQFVIIPQNMVCVLVMDQRDLLLGRREFPLLGTVLCHVLIVVNHQFKDVLIDFQKFKAVGELSVFSIEDMSLVMLLLIE